MWGNPLLPHETQSLDRPLDGLGLELATFGQRLDRLEIASMSPILPALVEFSPYHIAIPLRELIGVIRIEVADGDSLGQDLLDRRRVLTGKVMLEPADLQ
jgi:hypothetical protein